MKTLLTAAAAFLASLLIAIPAAVPAATDDTATGTRIKNLRPNYPNQMLMLQEPTEVDEIRDLLRQGRGEQALALARDFVARLDRFDPSQQARYRYFAHNALCSALTANGHYDEAVDSCSIAMEVWPGRWSAVNNRGTAQLMRGDFEAALADYRQALELADGNAAAAEAIRHNMALAEQRREAAGLSPSAE